MSALAERRRIAEIVKACALIEKRQIERQVGLHNAQAIGAYGALDDLYRAVVEGRSLEDIACKEDIADEARRAVLESFGQSGGRP